MTSAPGSSEKDKEIQFNTLKVSFFMSETTCVTNVKQPIVLYSEQKLAPLLSEERNPPRISPQMGGGRRHLLTACLNRC